MKPSVSIIIPARDSAETVIDAITSALQQAAENLPVEVIVVDDGSVDDTASIVRALDDDRVILLHQPASGVVAARNRAASAAQGDWLVPLDSDDVLLSGAVASLLAETAVDVDVVCGGVIRMLSNGSCIEEHPGPCGPEYHSVVGLFLAGAMLIRSEAWRSVGGQLSGLTYGENGELGMRLADRAHQLGRRIAAIDVLTVRYTQREVVRQDDVARAEAARLIAETDYHLLARSRRALASYWSISAVHSARADQARAALRAQLAACRADPFDLRQVARLVAMSIPLVRRRLYRPREVGAPGN